MQPYTEQFAGTNLTACEQDMQIGTYSYRVFIDKDEGFVLEKGPEAERRLAIAHVLGGKNVYYFLTPMERGRLQTLPLAYDVPLKQWFDTAESAVRHFPSAEIDEALHWTDPSYTFNASCYGCHVSQLRRNYDIDTDTYHTTWAEPGINCETCHGPAQEHVRAYRQASEKDSVPEDLGLISTKAFSAEQMNSLCNSCHAKMSPITASFKPGEKYFDHFDLVTIEHADFYPDGRDLGENYTMTSWLMSPCVKGGNLDCMHCHTSSGRYRFQDAENPNAVCLPCHSERVENATAHTHHEADSAGNSCVACHMPMTRFARMSRSDHSMRPPTPATTLQFQSPNACNVCHDDKDADWADEYVRRWHDEDYQKPVLESASLLRAARRGKWNTLEQMLAYIGSSEREEVLAASLIKSLGNCESVLRWPTVTEALKKDPSPLVRAAAAHTLRGYITESSLPVLLQATTDEYRIVRIRAAEALAAIPPENLQEEHQSQLRRAIGELMESFTARPDDYASHYNKGNFHMDRMEYEKALKSYRMAIELRPDFVPPYVNMAFVYNASGKNKEAESAFHKAVVLDPNNAAIHLNLGMLLGEMQRPREAEEAFRQALKIDPNSAAAAYNLGVLLAESHPQESLDWCLKAFQLRPDGGKYGYTYAFFLNQRGDTDAAIAVLQDMIRRQVPYGDAHALLGTIYLGHGETKKAADVYRAAETNELLNARMRQEFKALRQRLE
jgi:tetratricopeptide (TPR) repeat protein